MAELEMSGVIENIVFRNEANGWTVMELAVTEMDIEDDEGVGQGDIITVVGTIPYANPGEGIEAVGEWVSNTNYGRQFKVSAYEKTEPHNEDAMQKYLSSGAVKGIGPVMAEKIVKQFGMQSFHVLENEPERLAELKGISANKANEINAGFKSQFGLRKLMMFLQSFNVSPAISVRIYKLFGTQAEVMIRNNPYCLCDSGLGISFEGADGIADELGFSRECSERIKAGIKYALRHNLNNGHTFLPRNSLAAAASSITGCEDEKIEESIDESLTANELKQFIIQTDSMRANEVEAIYLTRYYEAEQYCAMKIAAIAAESITQVSDLENKIDEIERRMDIEYAQMQKEAIMEAASSGVFVLTGGPGTGKTTTLKGIIEILSGMNMEIILTAPTGRAAKRMTELCGTEARTMHRVLEAEYASEGHSKFSRNEQNPISADVIIVDEFSMVDILLLEALLKAMSPQTKLIIVGDSDQLPSVGAGNVLYDIIGSERISTVRLDEIFRQATESLIVVNAHAINHGEFPELAVKDRDFFFMPVNNGNETVDVVLDLISRRLPKAYGNEISQKIQVLTVCKKGTIGTVNLNKMLQAVLNPLKEGMTERQIYDNVMRVGDKVMQIKNNYDIGWKKESGEIGKGVFNGDIGTVDSIDFRSEYMNVRYDDRLAEYSFADLGELELAYAITVHKSQGSEFDVIIMPVFYGPEQLLHRKILYTAVTRAKSMLILVGNAETVRIMTENEKQMRRFSGLKYAIREKIKIEK